MSTLKLLTLAASAAFLPATGAHALADPAPEAGHWRDAPPPHRAHHPEAAARTEVRRELHRQMHRGDGPMRHVRRFSHVPRIQRGGMVPQMWWGPQFMVRNWHGYGFPQPFAGGRWIRYYDDALLIDRYGRVHDGRYGWDWSRGGERWGEGPGGVPVYVGDGDFEPGEWDYEWAERWERGERPDGYGYGHDGPPPHPGYGAHAGYAGCGCGPMVVTETTTTTAPVVELVTWYETVYEDVPVRRTKAKPVKRYKTKTIRRPAPPRPGERG